MTEWITDAINQAINSAWATIYGKLVGFVTLSFIDPFWHWMIYGALIILAVTAIVWFFGGLSNFIRAIGGVIVLGIIAMLYAYAKGEKEARDFDKKKRRR